MTGQVLSTVQMNYHILQYVKKKTVIPIVLVVQVLVVWLAGSE
jgi:hypothetical protein